ncbi:MAG TPA: PAS domain-containing protein, partial [Anaerolineae bacterium]|nr:PAS domain-containing protein [Anaerolineae bacterium]
DRITPAELWQTLIRQPEGTVSLSLADNEIAIALRSGQKPIGLLHLRRSTGDLTPAERNLLTLMAGPIATALENTALYREIQEARDHFRTILDNLHDEVMVVDRQQIITDVNTPFLQNRGLRREEVIGQPCSQVLQQSSGCCRDIDCPCPEEVWRTGQPLRRRHVPCQKADGTAYVVDITTLPLRDDQGEMVGAVHVLHDVTAEWELESTLATVRELGRSLVLSRDQDEIARLVVDTAERVLDFEWCDLWLVEGDHLRLLASAGQIAQGLSLLPLDGEQGITVAVARSGQAIYLPDVRRDERYINGRPEARSELCVPLTVQGRVLGVLNAESPQPDAFDHTERQILATLADQAALALENARLYQQVAQAEREWAATFDAIADGISIHDTDFRIVRANRALAERLGRSAEELIGQTCYRLFHQTDAPIPECPHAQALVTGQPHTVEIEEPALGGTFRVSAYPLTDETGQLIGSVHIFQDITLQKQFQDRLIQTEKLAALGRLAASLAHEINNPLQALRSGLGLLLKGAQDEKQQQYLQVADREVERLIDITTRMLNFYRPSAERQREPLDVNEALDEVLTLTGKQLQHKGVALVRRLEPDLPLVEAVSDQLRQVFLNIVLNALDAMPQGGTLTVASGVNRDAGEVRVSFTDTGNGIPAENIPRIFEPLFSTKPRGTGLGLAISYGIIERHGGRIEVQSQVGQGSTFTIVLPAASSSGQ